MTECCQNCHFSENILSDENLLNCRIYNGFVRPESACNYFIPENSTPNFYE